jgi:DNA-binding response OmpR family regulator
MPNILIVEDDININNLLCEVLMKAGYTCEQAQKQSCFLI